MIAEAERGYSNVVQFSNPSGGKSQEYQGVGFQIDEVAGERLTPIIVARNVGSETAIVQAQVPYTRTDGTTGVVELPQTKLRVGEMELLNVQRIVERSQQEQIQIAGLEVKYDTVPGSVILNAHSISADGNQVFRVPMWDPLGQRSPTGGYPWRIEETSTTRTYIKNITDREQYYVAYLKWENGEGYMFGMKSVEPHQTVEIDVKRLRDEQVPDVAGRTIPLDVSRGQLMWSLKQMGPPPAGEEARQSFALIGRSEQVDVERGVSSNYSCQSCCSNGYYSSFVSPGSSDVEVDAQVGFTAYQQDKDCYGDVTLPYPRTFSSWSSSDTETSTVNGSGQATAVSAGDTTIEASWTDYRYDLRFVPCSDFSAGAPQCYDCDNPTEVYPSPSAVLQVRPRITGITPSRGLVGSTINLTIAGRGFRAGQTTVNAGSGITVSVGSVSATQIQADFAIAANSTGGNRNVTVTARGRTSNSMNFFVQTPSRFQRFDYPGAPGGYGPLTLTSSTNNEVRNVAGQVLLTNQCGVYRNLVYELKDQEGQAITQPFDFTETFSNYSGVSTTPDPVNGHSSRGLVQDTMYFGKTLPNCPASDDSESFDQRFIVTISGAQFSLSTVVHISRGRSSGNWFVDVTTTTP